MVNIFIFGNPKVCLMKILIVLLHLKKLQKIDSGYFYGRNYFVGDDDFGNPKVCLMKILIVLLHLIIVLLQNKITLML